MPGLKSLLTLVTGVVIVSALYLAREVLIPFTLAMLLSFVLAPLVEALRRLYVPHVLSVLVAALIGLGAIGAVGGVIGMQVAGLAADVPQYASTIETKITSVRAYTLGPISELTNRLDRPMTAPVASPPPSSGGIDADPRSETDSRRSQTARIRSAFACLERVGTDPSPL